MLSASQAEKNKYHMTLIINGIFTKKSDIIEVENRIMETRGWELKDGGGMGKGISVCTKL